MEGAAQVFNKLGYHGATTDLVAERAGVSVGTLYQYFPDKDVLLVALFERHLDETQDLYKRVGEALDCRTPLEDIVTKCVSAMFDLHRPFPQLHRVFVEDAPLPGRVFVAYAELERPIRSRWAAYLRGQVANPELVAAMTVATLETLTHRLILYPPRGPSSKALEASAVDMVLAYIEASRTGT